MKRSIKMLAVYSVLALGVWSVLPQTAEAEVSTKAVSFSILTPGLGVSLAIPGPGLNVSRYRYRPPCRPWLVRPKARVVKTITSTTVYRVRPACCW
ncbi:MAG: hypothetical protein CSA33_06890 [Desulfobulbus propionicus]|nr:MAG: hypothetical protein CSA33_06890 [Desulfobulbus propionicus]